jgi:hypothetical protein
MLHFASVVASLAEGELKLDGRDDRGSMRGEPKIKRLSHKASYRRLGPESFYRMSCATLSL